MKKNLTTSVFIYLIFAVASYGCSIEIKHRDKSEVKKETREVSNFSSISLSVSADVILVQGSPQKVVLEGEADDLKNTLTEVDGSRLEIKRKSWNFDNNKIKVYITVAEINGLTVSGSGSIISEGSVKTEDLKLTVTGSGDIKLYNLKATFIKSVVSGSGDISIDGKDCKPDEQILTVTGSGDIHAENVVTKQIKVNVTGSGSCKINATEKIDANVTGSGDIYYRGGAIIDAHVTGSGKVRSME
jgi:hypothetical protein